MGVEQLTFKLISGDLMPLIGFGTFQISGRHLIHQVLDAAFASGYRAIDTATVYHNEEDIGVALKQLLPKYGLKREDIFITSKLPPSHHGERAEIALNASLEKLGCDYLDLYLIHWPGQQGRGNTFSDSQARSRTWENLVKAKRAGKVRNIGVSNYTVRHLSELLSNCFGEKPAVNQVEWHPQCHQADLRKLCKREGILLQAYSSLGGSNNPHLLNDPLIVKISSKLNKSPAQVLLRWSLQQHIGIIPKARSKEHIQANIHLDFEIPESDMSALYTMSQHKYAWDPNTIN